jgi:sensor c-di-GMP phosphodiesterase-like protein
VRGIANDADDKAIAEAIIALGRALDLTIVAEGVETAEQEAVLRAHDCDEIQGFLISEPISAGEFAAFIADHTLAELKAVAKSPPFKAYRPWSWILISAWQRAQPARCR